MKQIGLIGLLSFFILLLAGCATNNQQANTADGLPNDWRNIDVSHIPNATPRPLPKSKYGNPTSYVVFGKRYYTLNSAIGYQRKGIASWYGTGFHERRTSSGEPYNMYAMTAANKVLPLPTFVRVTNLENGRWVIVKVNDRGPFHENRIIDLSFAAAKKLDMIQKGTALVEVTAINPKRPEQYVSRYLPSKKARVYLQLGAFRDFDNAERLRNKVYRLTHLETFISTRRNHHHDLYRVRIGPMRSVDDADAWVGKLKQLGFKDIMEVVI